jgi:aldehyde dehydrogenase (NAD+)
MLREDGDNGLRSDFRSSSPPQFSADTIEHARKVARQIRAGNVNLQGVPNDRSAPFGGYKQSGNGREWGHYGLEEYLEAKAVAGWTS